MRDIIQEFQAAGRNHGIDIPDGLAPGKIVRFSDGANKRNKNCWAVLHINDDGTAGGAFGSWRDGTTEKWFSGSNGASLNRDKKIELYEKIKKTKKEGEQKQKQLYEATSKKAETFWKKASTPDPDHRYLKTKKILAGGIKQSGEKLIVPLQDETGKIWSLQYIDPDGNKKFLPDGKTKGCFAIIGDLNSSSSVYICEGFATGATISMATKTPVVVAFNTGNLEATCQIIKNQFPYKSITVAADNDLETKKKTGKNPGKEAGLKAAKAIKADITICPVNSDFNDLYCNCNSEAEAVEAVKKNFETTIHSLKWGKPIAFDSTELPVLNLSIFPGAIGQMIKNVSVATETPPELAAAMALAVLATACHGKLFVKIKDGWEEPTGLYMMAGMGPANRKSGVMAMMTKPISDYEKAALSALANQIEAAKSKRKLQEARLKHLRTQYARGKSKDLPKIETEILDLEENMIDIPRPVRVYCQDVTPEKLPILMSENNERMSNFSSEGGIFDTMAGRYTSSIPNIDIYLQSFSGDSHKVDRTGRESVTLNHPSLTIGIFPQPSVVMNVINNQEFRRRGLPARFFYFMPKSPLGFRTYDTNPVSAKVKMDYHELITTLLDIQPKKTKNGHEIPYTIGLSNEAFQLHLDYCKSIEVQLRPGGNFCKMEDWAGKLAGNTARLAGLLHCAKIPNEPWRKGVDADTMKAAIELAECFSAHAQKIFNSSEVDPETQKAIQITSWIKAETMQQFSRRDCFEKFKGTLKTVKDLEPVLKLLIERNYIQLAKTEPKPGRKPIVYDVNPQIWEGKA